MFRLGSLVFFSLFISIVTFQFLSYSSNSKIDQASEGKALAATYCSGCHMLPTPDLLDKNTWATSVLPAMGKNMGITRWSGTYYKKLGRINGISIGIDDWNKVVAYYTNSAPDHLLPTIKPSPLQKDWAGFSLKLPLSSQTSAAATTLITIDSISHSIFSADAIKVELTQWNPQLMVKSIIKTSSPTVNALFSKESTTSNESILLTNIGSLGPSDRAAGRIEQVSLIPGLQLQSISKGLLRPVQTISADFNKDGLKDYVVCGFGHLQGSLDLLTQQKDGSFARSVIRKMPGSEVAITGDYNHDGWPDLMVLFAQADEGIWMFLNNQHGGFTTRKVMGFPSVWGSTSFQLVDFNKDGNPDILYTCGDNADYSPILKPYHGIYIYQNTGNFNFKKVWFYPVNGCTKAIAADFRKTGNLDIASIAFFADFNKQAEESCVYFRQDKPMHFSAHALPVHKYGRWLCMTVGDYDNDGDLDIILGSFNIPSMNVSNGLKGNETRYPFIVLENQLVSRKNSR